MDDLELIKMRLSRTPVSELYTLAKMSGVPYGTLWNIKARKSKSPRYQTVRKLADFFKQQKAA
jgi:predicted transcriptional regulator